MARFDIISKDGSTIRFSGKPRYIGSYLKPSYIEFSEIASPTPIAWEAGDYVDYSRTGMRYRLYSIPQPSKNARKDTHGRAFTYSNVQLHAATKELEIAPFRDLVPNDNGIHFSTAPDVATFENVYGIARRIQACMDDLYPSRWEIRVAEFSADTDAEVIDRITTAKDFALSGGTCLDALSKIYELWQDIGWIHTHEDGVEVITIGYANKRIAENTSEPYLYGKGLGLTAIKKNQTNKDEFATRLYVYGSERNLPSRYYNGKNILNAESVDIRNLMLPLDSWGLTDGLPDARKAYLENAEAVAKFGVIPKVHYFDSDDAGANIYPSISGMTIGMVRKALADMSITEYSPSTETYPDASERVDEVKSITNPADDGVLNKDGKQFDEVKEIDISGQGSFSISSTTWTREFTIVETSFAKSGKGEVSIAPDMNIIVIGENLQSVKIRFDLADQNSIKFRSVVDSKTVSGVQSATNSAAWSVKIPSLSIRQEKTTVFPVYLTIRVEITTEDTTERNITIRRPSSPLEVRYARVLESTFRLILKQVGFDIDKQASLGEGKVISMKTGACAGRNFEISACRYQSDSDTWAVDCKRQQDDTLGMLFPNADYPIVASDRFVLLEIAMPESYIRVAMERLLAEGQKLLTRASKVLSHYEPSVDAKVMAESGRTLREGMFMEISDADVVDGVTDYILIDTLSIYEDESAIPTYKVTLRERRKVTYKGTPSATSATATKSVEDVTTDGESEVEVDLSNYYTKSEVDGKITTINGVLTTHDSRIKSLEDMWYLENGVVKSNYPIMARGYAAGATATVEEGGGSGAIINKDSIISALGYTPYDSANPAGYITVTALTGYATKTYVTEEIGKIDLTPYATKNALGLVDNRVKTLESYFSTSDDADAQINKWNEIVSFLDATEGTTLAGILAAYTLKSDFNSAVSTIDSRLTSLEDMWYIEDGVLKTRYPILSKGYAAGAVATVGEGGGGAILNKESIIAALGYTPYDAANPNEYITISALSGYLPLSGGTISSGDSVVPLTLDSDGASTRLRFTKSDALLGYLGFVGENNPCFIQGDGNYRTLLHSNNIGSYNAGSATKLATARTIWGQSFDGTADVSGSLTIYKNSSDYTAGWARHTNVRNSANTILSAFGFYGTGEALEYAYIGPSYSSPQVSIRPSGNVGIGVAYPAYKLDVNGTARISGAVTMSSTLSMSGSINLDNGVSILGKDSSASARSILGVSADNSLLIGHGSSAANMPTYINGSTIYLRYGTSRLVGITLASDGAVTLAKSLSVGGSITLPLGSSLLNPSGQSAFMVDGNGHVQVGHGTVDKTTYINGNSVALRYGSSRTLGLYLSSSGNVGIGITSPAAKLDVNGDIKINGALTRGFQYAVDADIAGNLKFKTDGTDWKFYKHDGTTLVTVKGIGNVGIGTTSPEYKLDVAGTGRFSGAVTMSSTLSMSGSINLDNGVSILGKDSSASARSILGVSADNSLLIGHGSSAANMPTYINGSTIYLRYGTSRTVGITLASDGNVAIAKALSVGGNITPTAHNAYSLGTYGKAFGNAHINTISSGAENNNLWIVGGSKTDSTAIIFARNATGLPSNSVGRWNAIGLRPDVTNTVALGTSDYRWSTIYGVNGNFSGTLAVTGATTLANTLTARHIYPNADNTYNLGDTQLRWKNLHCNLVYATGIDADALYIYNSIYSEGDIYSEVSLTTDGYIKIGDATISYESGVLKIDKPIMTKGYAAGATATAASGGGGSVVSFTPVLNAGTKIGTLTIDGTPHELYCETAPTVPTVTSSVIQGSTSVVTSGGVYSAISKLSGMSVVLSDINGSSASILPNAINTIICNAATTLNFLVTPIDKNKPCVVHIIKNSSVTITIPPFATSKCRFVTSAGAIQTSTITAPAFMGITLVWNTELHFWDGFFNN